MYAVLLRLDLDCRKTIVHMERERCQMMTSRASPLAAMARE